MKKLLFSVLLLLAGVWLVVDDLFSPLAPRAEIVEIPDFCGLAEHEIPKDDRFEIKREYRYDETAPKGEVLLQEPSSGSRRKRAANAAPIAVRLVISLGEESVLLPEAVGENARVVAAELRALGCTAEIEYRTGARPSGEVLSMSPPTGTRVPRGTKILLTVSAGTPEESVTVPNLVGLTRAEALTRIWLAQLSLASAEEIDATEDAGTVVAQNYQTGTKVPAGTRITIYISREAGE